MLFLFPLGEDERAHDGDEDEERRQFERVDEFLEEHRGDLFGGFRDENLCGRRSARIGFEDERGERCCQRKREREAGKLGEL